MLGRVTNAVGDIHKDGALEPEVPKLISSIIESRQDVAGHLRALGLNAIAGQAILYQEIRTLATTCARVDWEHTSTDKCCPNNKLALQLEGTAAGLVRGDRAKDRLLQIPPDLRNSSRR